MRQRILAGEALPVRDRVTRLSSSMRRFRTACLTLTLAVAGEALAVDALALRDSLDHNPYATARLAAEHAVDARGKGDTRALLEALTQIAMAYNLVGNSALAQAPLNEAQRLAKERKDVTAEALLLAVEGEMKSADNRVDDARIAFKAAIDAAEHSGDKNAEALVRTQYGWFLTRSMQDTAESTAQFEAALQHFEKLGDRVREAELRSMSATLYDRLRDTKRGDAERLRALELIDPARQTYLASTIYYELGSVAQGREDRGVAERALRRSMELSRSIGDEIGVAFCAHALSEILIDQGNAREAAEMLTRAIPVLASGQNTQAVAMSEARLANARALLHDPAAWGSLERAKRSLFATGSADDENFYWRIDARVNAAFGHYEQAYAAAQQQIRALQRLFDDKQTQALAELSVRYETQRKEAENTRLRLAEALKDATIAAQNARQAALVGGLAAALLALAAGVILLRRQITLKREFRLLALRDELTGAPNRRAIMQFAEATLAHAREAGANAVIALIDLDHFKQINDNFGHDTGDAVLQRFYRTAATVIRPDDRIGRTGGEEWLLVLPTAPEGAEQSVFERLRRAIASLHIEGLPAERRITFSMGTARLRPGEALTHALRRADFALYDAKQSGRDRLSIAE